MPNTTTVNNIDAVRTAINRPQITPDRADSATLIVDPAASARSRFSLLISCSVTWVTRQATAVSEG
jgi:hypothetical protein